MISKQLATLNNGLGFQADTDFIHGEYGDVYVTVKQSGSILYLYFDLSTPSKNALSAIRAALKQQKKLIGAAGVQQHSDHIVVTTAKIKKLIKSDSITALLNTVIESAKANGAAVSHSCIYCGRATSQVALHQDHAARVCSHCVSEIAQINKRSHVNPLSFLTGIIGAVLGAAIGSIPWIIVYYKGWVLGILAFVIGMSSFYGYKLFKGPKNRMIANITIYIASFLTILSINFLIIAAVLFTEGITVSLENILLVMSYADSRFYLDIVITLCIGVAGLVGLNKKIAEYTVPQNIKILKSEESIG